jgi:hypothetical protein
MENNVYYFLYGNGKKFIPSPAFDIEPYRWHVLNVSFGKTDIRFYVDGKLVAEQNKTEPFKQPSINTMIGAWQRGGRLFMGQIAEVLITEGTYGPDNIAEISERVLAGRNYMGVRGMYP